MIGGNRAGARVLAVATALALMLALAPAAGAATGAEAMYEPGTVDVIDLTLPPASVAKLEAEPEAEYVEGTFSLAETEGTPATVKAFTAPITVGIRLKGSLGSLRSIHEKAAFKIKLNYVKGQKFLGLKKMTLNNMVQDPSMVHETMAYELFRANRVAGPHTGFAYVYVNGENFGLHLNIETMDQEALEARFGEFGPPQHLYEGEYGADVTAAAESKFEVDEGEEGDRSDLEALVAAMAGSTPADFSERVAPLADLQEMVHQWAVEKYIGHWDGYAGQQGSYWPNNYYLYSSATGVFQMLPWGTDQTWGDRLGFAGAAGILFDECLADASCATMYRRALRELLASLPGLGLDSLATRTAALLEPWQALEASPRRPYGATEIHGAVESTRDFAADRSGELEVFLASGPAEAVGARIAVAATPESIPVGGGTGTVTATVEGAAGEPIFGEAVAFAATDPGIAFGPVVDAGEGVYTASFSGTAAPGPVTVTATDAGPGLSATTTLTQLAPESVGTGAGPGGAGPGGSGNTTTAGSGTGAGASGEAAQPAPPTVSFTAKPGHRTSERRPRFAFGSDRPGSRFECRVGNDSFRPCSSPLRLPALAAGHHSFSVVAVGPDGTRGTATRYEFVLSIRNRIRVPDRPLSIATSSQS
jgi:CotH kinase protein/Invasin, domain 3